MYEIHSQTISEIAKALAKAQGEFDSAKKNTANTFHRSKYADLSAVWDALRDILPKHGLSVIQTMMPQDEDIVIEKTTTDKKTGNQTTSTAKMKSQMLVTTLLHSSGEWFKSYATLVIDKPDMQGLGSAITYQRRYSLASICGITQDDDDGNAACRTQSNQQESPKQEKKQEITPEQVKILADAVAATDEKFQKYFNGFMTDHNLSDIRDMSLKTYNQILATANSIVRKKILESSNGDN